MVQSAFIISDIHLGATTSLLTVYDDTNPDKVRPLAELTLSYLLDELKNLLLPGEKVHQCILLGDIFDFSFASYGLSMKNAQWFFEQLVACNLFEEFIYIPGNHDHHVWQQIIEYHYLMRSLRAINLDYPKTLPPTTLLENTFLNDLLPNDDQRLLITYPNYHMTIADKHFYLHHGHFLQKLYVAASNFLSEVLETEDIDDLELMNAPFLEFGWYNLCQAYNIGHNKLIDRLYFMIKNQHTQGLDRLLRLFLQKVQRWDDAILPSAPIQQPRSWLARWFSKAMSQMIMRVGPFVLKQLFFKHSSLFSKRHYASSARHKPIEGELEYAALHYLKHYMLPSDDAPCPSECYFIFGHTHEPTFDRQLHDNDLSMHLYNTGGWIVDTLDENQAFVLPHMMPLLIRSSGEIASLTLHQEKRRHIYQAICDEPSFATIKSQMQRT